MCPAETRVELPDGTTTTVRCAHPDTEGAHSKGGLGYPDGWSEHYVPAARTGGARLLWPVDHADRARWRL